MKIIVKCWTPEWYDAVTHAILDLSADMVEKLLKRIAAVNKTKQVVDGDLIGWQFDDYTPVFVNVGDPECIGMTEEAFDDLSDSGWEYLPDNTELEEVGLRPVTLFAMQGRGESGGRVYWQGYDKHGGAESRVETYSLHESDLRAISGKFHAVDEKRRW